jgi:1-acyl-sn-glycerol-3-phosphate acyltransferase
LAAIQAVRTAIFYLLFIGQTAVLAIVVAIIATLFGTRGRPVNWAIAQYWRNSNVFLLRWVVGIRTVVEGGETIPPGPCIIAAKHQSDWDIFAILPFTDDKPAYIAKRELIDIPFFGHAARSLHTISIDRRLGANAIPAMLAEARERIAAGCRIVIYPEGTRKAPLADPDYRQGVVRLYETLGVPVVPVALNSGLFWGRNSLLMWPGTARAKFLPAIPPGMPTAEFAALLKATIERETTRLIADAVAGGISRPLGAEFRRRLEGATQAAAVEPGETH